MIRSYEGSLIGFKRTATRPQLRAALYSYSVQLLSYSYALDNGVPYPKRDFLDVAVLEAEMWFGHDPEKPLRVAAFSGWALITPRELRSIGTYLDPIRAQYEATISRIEKMTTGLPK